MLLLFFWLGSLIPVGDPIMIYGCVYMFWIHTSCLLQLIGLRAWWQLGNRICLKFYGCFDYMPSFWLQSSLLYGHAHENTQLLLTIETCSRFADKRNLG